MVAECAPHCEAEGGWASRLAELLLLGVPLRVRMDLQSEVD